MQRTSIHGEEDLRRDGDDGQARPSDGLVAVNQRLVQDLDIARAHERTLMFELANAARDLHEKDLLLGEVEHRLKNTLHLAHGLLMIQARGAAGKDAKDELEAAGARLKAVAEVQIGLHDIGGEVRLDQWLPVVCRSMALNPGVEVDVRVAELSVPGAVASPIGLFAWEAVCNALKHGFPDDDRGRVFVQLGREGDDWRLTVADNGCGGPDRIRPGFGLRLLGVLARQLRGRLDIGRGLDGRGLSVSAVFSMPEAQVPS